MTTALQIVVLIIEIHTYTQRFDSVPYGKNFLKCFEISLKNVLSCFLGGFVFLHGAEFPAPENKELPAKCFQNQENFLKNHTSV